MTLVDKTTNMQGQLVDKSPILQAMSESQYPDGFDAACGLSPAVMSEANALACDLTGNRAWDVPCIAAALNAIWQASRQQALEEAEQSIKALARLLPLFEKLTKDVGFTAERAGQINSDMNALRSLITSTGEKE